MTQRIHLVPQWAAPAGVHAAFTLRRGGVSAAPFDSLNLGTHVGDAAGEVAENRHRVATALALPSEPLWLGQVHGTRVLDAESGGPREGADAIVSRRPGSVAAIQVADCLPVLFAARDGSSVAAAHAGWRGLAAGIIEATFEELATQGAGVVAWLGPCIGTAHFEVGEEVRAAFVRHDAQAQAAFHANARGRFQCDLVLLARQRLAACGVQEIAGGQWCTFQDRERFFSYRRDGQCGRMAALIWRS